MEDLTSLYRIAGNKFLYEKIIQDFELKNPDEFKIYSTATLKTKELIIKCLISIKDPKEILEKNISYIERYHNMVFAVGFLFFFQLAKEFKEYIEPNFYGYSLILMMISLFVYVFFMVFQTGYMTYENKFVSKRLQNKATDGESESFFKNYYAYLKIWELQYWVSTIFGLFGVINFIIGYFIQSSLQLHIGTFIFTLITNLVSMMIGCFLFFIIIWPFIKLGLIPKDKFKKFFK